MRKTCTLASLALVPAALLTACTFGDLGALGAGGGDAEVTPETGTGMTPGVDSGSTPGVDATTEPDVDSGTGQQPVDGGGGGEAEAATDAPPDQVAPPAQAPPVYLDGGSPGWCDQHPGYAFCADFDETPLPAGFSASDGAFLVQTSSLPSSAPNDLLLLVPAQPGSGSWGSKLSRSFSTPATSIVLAFDFYPEIVGDSGMLFAALDFLGNASAKYSVRLAFNNEAPRLEESYLGSPADVYHSNFSVPANAWSRIQMELTFPPSSDAGGAGSADAGTALESVYVNGVLQGTSEVLTPPQGFDPRPNLLVGGVYGTSPNSAWALRYDNVTLDIQ